MTITRRQAFGYVNLLVGLIVLAGLAIGWLVWQASWQDTYGDSVTRVEESNQIEVRALGMLADGTGLNTNSLMTLTHYDELGGEAIGYLGEAGADLAPVLDSLAALESAGSEGAAAVENMRSLVNQHQQVAEAAYVVAASSNVTQGLADITEKVIPLAQEIQTAATAYRESAKTQQTTLLDDLDKNSTIMFWVVIAWTVLAIGTGAAFNLVITRTTKRHLNAAVSSISTSAAEMLAVSSQVAASAAQTAASTNETMATVEEVKQTALLAHEKATQVAENSHSLAQGAESGRVRTEETLVGIAQMQSQMGVVAETINRLSDQTQAVGEIIATVNDLAEQSNLLSVNASIEAAKAGDQGKGFTVVAQEVKNLAEQSKQAVSQARMILSEIQKASSLAVQAAEQSREAIEAGRQQSLVTDEAISELAENVNDSAQSAAQIAASSRQQLAGMEQISQAIESINQAGNQSVSGTRQVEQEVKNLQELALRLKRLVDSKAKA